MLNLMTCDTMAIINKRSFIGVNGKVTTLRLLIKRSVANETGKSVLEK